MPLRLVPGNSLTCRINAHRHRWNGKICTDADIWNCGAPSHFRVDYCTNGDRRCFHIDTFAADNPGFIIEGNGGDWVFEDDPQRIDDQLLFFSSSRTNEGTGIPEGYGNQRMTLIGAYRVKSVERLDFGFTNRWLVRPYPDGWAEFSGLHIRSPRPDDAGGRYVKQIDHRDVERVFAEADCAPNGWADAATLERFKAFRASYPKWIEVAAERAKRFSSDLRPGSSGGSRDTHYVPEATSSGIENRPLKSLEKLRAGLESPKEESVPPEGVTAAPRARGASNPNQLEPLAADPQDAGGQKRLEPGPRSRIEEVYGTEVRVAVEVALCTRDLIVLQGEPGVGKSYLALQLLEDAARERTLVVPVAATWRGREDLLGYVNPIDGKFVSTPFTHFLESAAAAWEGGDKRTRVVVFEEFNLSQPEHWLADVLAVAQYSSDKDRQVHLCHRPDGSAYNVMLSPALRFVGTVNNDHTTRSLSPRVLDRAAVVSLNIVPKEAMRRVGLETLEDGMVKAIDDLDRLLSTRGAAFSIRTALAMKQCLELGIESSQRAAVDLILSQQVLSKVELSPHEALDLMIIEQLSDWSAESGRNLQRCGALIEHWQERLAAGREVRGS